MNTVTSFGSSVYMYVCIGSETFKVSVGPLFASTIIKQKDIF